MSMTVTGTRTADLPSLLAFHARPEHAPAFARATTRRRILWTSARRIRVELELAANGGRWV